MAEPDFSVTTPDWMKQGRDVGDEWLRMQAGNQNQRRVNLQEQEQNALLPLKMREFQQKSQLDGLRLQDEFKKRQDIIDAEIAAQELARGPIADLLKAGKAEEALNAFLEAGIRNPNLRKSKAYGEMSDDLRFTLQVKENARLRQSGYYGAPPREAKLGALYERAVAEGDEHMAGVYKAALDSETIKQKNAGTRIEQAGQRIVREETKLQKDLTESGYAAKPNADGTVTLTPIVRPETTANVTRNQEALSTSLSAIRQVRQLKPLINSGTFGPLAYVESKLIDKGLANVYPELLNKERVQAGVLSAQLRAATTRALRSDGNIAEPEREAIIADIPDNKKFLASPAEAMVQIETINRGIVDRAVQSSRRLRQPISNELAPEVPSDMVGTLVKENLMTPEQARQWYEANRVQ